MLEKAAKYSHLEESFDDEVLVSYVLMGPNKEHYLKVQEAYHRRSQSPPQKQRVGGPPKSHRSPSP